ncbi:MAG: rhomboid family intramembrane serine protease, partial [Candidatus Xenobia bacterium]
MSTEIRFGLPQVTPMMRVIIVVTSVFSVLGWFIPELVQWMGLVPTDVLHHYQVWRLLTYMLLHAGVSHMVFNMLA